MAYKNYRKKDIKNAKPGYAPNAWLIDVEEIDTFAEPVGGDAIPGNKYIIDESHVLKTDKAAIAVYCAPKTTEGNGELGGEPLARTYAWKPKIIIVGDSAEKQELVDRINNGNWILLVKDAECGTNEYIQFGCDCDPCEVEASTFASGTTGTGRKQTEITFVTYCKYFYRGVIVELEDVEEEETP